MNRRQLLQGATAASLLSHFARSGEPIPAAPRASALIKPRRLRACDTLAVIAPSSGLSAASFDKAVRNREALGFKIRVGPHARGNHGIFSGTDRERLDDLHRAFRDPEVHGVWCARGGNGSQRLLTQLRQSVDLKQLAGVAVGILAGCEPTEKWPSPPVCEVIRQHLAELGIPAISGLSFGHIRDQFTLPMGIEAELDTASATLTLLETGVT